MMMKLVRGTVAGYVGTAAMDASQTSIIPAVSQWLESRNQPDGKKQQADESSGEQQGESEKPLSSPEKVAKWGADRLGVDLDREQIGVWGNRVHWVYGTQWGIVYVLLRQKPGPISGLIYGAALWLLSDELLLWALRIAKAPSEYPMKSHLQALASHSVYGCVVGTVAKGLRR